MRVRGFPCYIFESTVTTEQTTMKVNEFELVYTGAWLMKPLLPMLLVTFAGVHTYCDADIGEPKQY